MSQQSRTISATLFQMAFAFYLGYAFWDFFLKGFVPDSGVILGAVISGAVFFWVLRWLNIAAPQAGQTKTETTSVLKSGIAQKVSSCGKRCLLPPISFRHAPLPSWLSASRNRVFFERDKVKKPGALAPVR